VKKRKKIPVALIAFALILLSATSLIIYISNSRYKVKNQQIFASQINMTDIIQPDVSRENADIQIKSIVQHLKETNVNTAIVSINESRKTIVNLDGFDYIYINNDIFNKTDIIEKLKKALNKEKIQLYLSVDCENLSDETIFNAVSQIRDNYSAAGVVLDNFIGEKNVLQQIKSVIGKGLKKFVFILQADNTDQIEEYIQEDLFDIYIGENISSADYTQLKSVEDEKILLHYSSQSVESDIFVLTNFSKLDGVVISDLSTGYGINDRIDSLLKTDMELPAFNFNVSTDFNVTYPTKDITTYYSGIFVTGTGRTGGTVKINGTEYPSQPDGTFGVYVELEKGENILTVSRNENSKTYTITRKTYSSSSTGGTAKLPWDDTEKLKYGRIVQTIDPLTSMLSDPDDDSAIIAGIEPGTKLIVVDSVKTKRNGKQTYAYQLSNGGYVLASKVEILSEVSEDYNPGRVWTKYGWVKKKTDYTTFETSVITQASADKMENGDEIITFNVNNPPAVISEFNSEKLGLHFLDAEIRDINLPESDFYTEYTTEYMDDGTHITLHLNKENLLWGYDVSSSENTITLYLKKSPRLNKGDKPLEGVIIMLDAGHGDYDSGALGAASVYGPLEKDLNLAVALAAKTLLEHKGATVLMTRSDDTFLELEQRRSMIRQYKPDLFIAVHHNSMDYSYNSTKARGSECYYFTSQSENLANIMCEKVSMATARYNRGAKTGYYYVTRTDIAPSVLMEYSFIINSEEFAKTYKDIDIYKAAYGTMQAVIAAIPK